MEFLKQNYTARFSFTKIDTANVMKIIDNMKPKTSYCCYGISMKLLKSCKDILAGPLQLIINQMLITGIFPDKLKLAKINTIYKKDDPTNFTNYRPISLLPSI